MFQNNILCIGPWYLTKMSNDIALSFDTLVKIVDNKNYFNASFLCLLKPINWINRWPHYVKIKCISNINNLTSFTTEQSLSKSFRTLLAGL